MKNENYYISFAFPYLDYPLNKSNSDFSLFTFHLCIMN